MKVAYISHVGRPNYEYNWFSRLGCETIKFIDVDFSSYPKDQPSNVAYCQVPYTENALFKGRFHSTASMVQYQGFEKYLEDVDVVIVLEAFSSLSKQFTKYCKENNKKIVVLVYELIPTHPLYYLPTHIFNRFFVAKHADLFVCVSHKAANALRKLGIADSKIDVVYPGIDLSLFKEAVPPQHKLDLVFVGGMKEHKGIDLVLRLADELLPKRQELRVTIVGEGPYRSRAEAYAKRYPNFSYLGSVPNRELPAVLNKSGIYVLPCREMKKFGIKVTSEQFGFSLVEAMACGLAVISTDCGAIPEVITENNIVCNQGDYFQLLHAVEALLDNPAEVQSIGQKNIEIAGEKYDINKQGVALAAVLSNLQCSNS